jgi:hypothetical protein
MRGGQAIIGNVRSGAQERARPLQKGNPGSSNVVHGPRPRTNPSKGSKKADPVVRAVMGADGVNRHELEVMLRRVAQRLRLRSGDTSEDLAALVRCRVQIS